ncbi:hypothetical protein [Granulicella sp. dw_53]|nr:hypothetical protein [Granulicella sp. dw_53]
MSKDLIFEEQLRYELAEGVLFFFEKLNLFQQCRVNRIEARSEIE